MEIKIKNKNKIKREEDPTRNQKWGILKYLSAEISFEKPEIIQDHRTRVSGVLGQKFGYDSVNIIWLKGQMCNKKNLKDQLITKKKLKRTNLL